MTCCRRTPACAAAAWRWPAGRQDVAGQLAKHAACGSQALRHGCPPPPSSRGRSFHRRRGCEKTPPVASCPGERMVKRRGHLWTFTDYDSVKLSATNNCPLSGLGERRREGHDAAPESGCPCTDVQSHTARGARVLRIRCPRWVRTGHEWCWASANGKASTDCSDGLAFAHNLMRPTTLVPEIVGLAIGAFAVRQTAGECALWCRWSHYPS